MVEPGMHAEAVIFDFMSPLIAIWHGVGKLSKLRLDPTEQRDRIWAAETSKVGRQLLEMVRVYQTLKMPLYGTCDPGPSHQQPDFDITKLSCLGEICRADESFGAIDNHTLRM